MLAIFVSINFTVQAQSAYSKQARIRAFHNAAKESAVAQKYADQVSKFIEEAFVE